MAAVKLRPNAVCSIGLLEKWRAPASFVHKHHSHIGPVQLRFRAWIMGNIHVFRPRRFEMDILNIQTQICNLRICKPFIQHKHRIIERRQNIDPSTFFMSCNENGRQQCNIGGRIWSGWPWVKHMRAHSHSPPDSK